MIRETNEVQHSGKPSPALPWRRVLVPIDFSKSSLRALEVAVPLAHDQGARLFLLNVVEPTPVAAAMEGVVIPVPGGALVQDAEARLARIANHFIPSPANVTTSVVQGRAYDAITRMARENNIDLIVLTTHSRSAVDRVLMGTTAERVVRHAHCPVYVVRGIRRRKSERKRS